MRKVFILNPVCQEDEVMGKLVHSFCRRGGQGGLPRVPSARGRGKRGPGEGGRYLRGASWRPAARGAATALPCPHARAVRASSGARPASAGSSAVALRLRRPQPASSEHAGKARAREGSWSERVRTRRNNQSGASAPRFRPCHPKGARPVGQIAHALNKAEPVIGCRGEWGGALCSLLAQVLFPWKPNTLPALAFLGGFRFLQAVCVCACSVRPFHFFLLFSQGLV